MFHLTTALDAASGVPLYEQLYESLAAEMRSGAIPAGTRMPGKRRLAAELSVSVNTVDAAYQILATEGYMEPRERSGFYVQEYLALPTRPEEVPPPVSAAPPEAAEPPVRFDLSTRGVDPGLFPFRTWARLQKELLYSSPQLLTHGDAQGDVELRQALADYLEEYRGVRCTAEQVVVGAGMEYLLSLLAPLLPGKTAVENPGYQRAKQVLENNGVACCCLPVDADGLSVEALSGSGAAGMGCCSMRAVSLMLNEMVVPLGPLSRETSSPSGPTSSHVRTSARVLRSRGGIPEPVSETVNSRWPGSVLSGRRWARICTMPRSVASTALSTSRASTLASWARRPS